MNYKNILAFPLTTIPLYFKFLEELHKRKYFEKVKFIVLHHDKYSEFINDSSLPPYCSFEYVNPEKIKGLAQEVELERLEEAYGLPTLNLFSLMAHRIKVKSQKPEDNLIFWESYLDQFKVDLIIMPFAAMVISVALVQVAKKRNIQVVYAHSIRAFGRAILTDANTKDGIYDLWDDLIEKYENYRKNGLTKNQIKTQEEKLKFIIEKKSRPIWFKDPPRRINGKRVASFFKILLNPKELKRKLVSEYNYNYLKFGVDELPKGNFILFPLHFEPEVTLDLLAPFFRDQITLVKYIAQSLPVKYKLVVKEHPGMKGLRARAFYKKIKAIPNVVLLGLDFDSYKVLDHPNCKGLTVINSTVGYEAVLLEKPVIIFGKTFYALSGITTPITDLTKLPAAIKKIDELKPKKENVWSFLQAMDEVTFEGFIYPPKQNVTWVLDSKNVNAIADEFEKKFPS